jgi:hypothetical protein
MKHVVNNTWYLVQMVDVYSEVDNVTSWHVPDNRLPRFIRRHLQLHDTPCLHYCTHTRDL